MSTLLPHTRLASFAEGVTLEPKFLLIVKVSRGLTIRDTPRPESMGARAMRSVGVGTALYAYQIINVGGVNYARLVPQNPVKPEWVRVAEADNSIVYVEVVELEATDNVSELADAITLLAKAVQALALKPGQYNP